MTRPSPTQNSIHLKSARIPPSYLGGGSAASSSQFGQITFAFLQQAQFLIANACGNTRPIKSTYIEVTFRALL